MIYTSVDTWSTLDWYFNRQSVKSQLIFADNIMPLSADGYIQTGWHFASYQSAIGQVSIEMLIECLPTV